MRHLRAFKMFEDASSITWYHGTGNTFDEFMDPVDTQGSGSMGIWATDDKGLAEMFGEQVLEVEMSYDNPYKITTEKWNRIRDKYGPDTEYFKKWREELMDKGYDALFVKEDSWTGSTGFTFKDPNIVCVFDASQAKIKRRL